MTFMAARTERQILRWVHTILSIPILGFIYGPVAANPRAAFATRYVFVPIVVLSGLWMWKGHVVRKHLSGSGHSPAAKGADGRRERSTG
jgi:thiosulfate reductase cytochrome b subunit